MSRAWRDSRSKIWPSRRHSRSSADSIRRPAWGLPVGSTRCPRFPSFPDAIRAEQFYFRETYRAKFESLDESDVAGPIREAFGLPEPIEENAGMMDWLYPAGDPAERMLDGLGREPGRPAPLADEVLEAFDRLAEVQPRGRRSPSTSG